MCHSLTKYLSVFAGLFSLAVIADTSVQTSALESAIRSNNVAHVRAALADGAEVSNKTASGTAFVVLALNFAADDVVNELLARGWTLLDAETKRLARDAAARWGRNKLLLAILDSGVSVNQVDSANKSVLHEAVSGAHEETVRLLLQKGADPNANSRWFGTSLNAAVLWNYHASRENIIRILLQAGADPNLNLTGGMTSIELAMRRPDMVMLPVVDMLLSAGADPSRKGSKGLSALDRVKTLGNAELAALFRKHSFDVMLDSAGPDSKKPPRRFDPDIAPIKKAVIEPYKPLRSTLFLAYGARKGGLRIRVQFRGERGEKLGFGSEGDLHTIRNGDHIVHVPEGARELSLMFLNHLPLDNDSVVSVYSTLLDQDGNATHISRLVQHVILKAKPK